MPRRSSQIDSPYYINLVDDSDEEEEEEEEEYNQSTHAPPPRTPRPKRVRYIVPTTATLQALYNNRIADYRFKVARIAIRACDIFDGILTFRLSFP
jgi:hypothetical protein